MGVHFPVLHSTDCKDLPEQADGLLEEQVLLLFLVPPPQLSEQLDQAPHFRHVAAKTKYTKLAPQAPQIGIIEKIQAKKYLSTL